MSINQNEEAKGAKKHTLMSQSVSYIHMHIQVHICSRVDSISTRSRIAQNQPLGKLASEFEISQTVPVE